MDGVQSSSSADLGAAGDTIPRAVLGIVCGMAAEARTLGRWSEDPRVAVALSAGVPDRAEAEAMRLTAGGVRMLLSWGIAGALDSALRPGALIVPTRVVDPDGMEHGLVAGLLGIGYGVGVQTNPVASEALLAGSDVVLSHPQEKRELRRRTGAVAVDMESHRVAVAATRAGMPCLVVRAISDPAERVLPALAASALGADGRPRVGMVLASLLRRPSDLPALIAAGRDSRAALAILRRVADSVMRAILTH